MRDQFESAITLIKEQNHINGCIAGSAMLGYQEGWNQDIDIFCYDEQSFIALLYFMHYNKLFNILDPLEKHKFEDFTRNNKSSLATIGLITIKFTYNLCIPVNIVFKKYQKNIFDVTSAFDIDLIAQGYCLATKQYLSLRSTKDKQVTWNKWSKSFYSSSQWDIKRILRQFDRVIKYSDRGYNLTEVTDKYIELVEDIISKENIYKSQKGNDFYEKTQKEFEIVLKILKTYKKDNKITPEELLILKTLI